MKCLYFNEHEKIANQKDCSEVLKEIKNDVNFPNETQKYISIKQLKYLGITNNIAPVATYYIGASWYIKNKYAFIVKPKIDVDYIKMFMTALENNSIQEAEYFSDYYYIDYTKPLIKIKSSDNIITPLLVIHYISLLYLLVSRRVKKGYVAQEDNLQSKIRGKILFQKHLKNNLYTKHEERFYCRYQEVAENIPENRLLKKAFLFSYHFINQFKSCRKLYEEMASKIKIIETAFENVSCDISLSQVNRINAGKIFRHYNPAMKIAKHILRHFDYSIDNIKNINKEVRPFCIDMSRLYEMYVLSILRKNYGNQIKFQVNGFCKTKLDYIKVGNDEKLILDAKYKPHYHENNKGLLKDVREISGYARDTKILKALNWKYNGECFPKCVIIYPIKMKNKECGIFDFDKDSLIKHCTEVKEFNGFYKLAIPLPSKM